MQPLKCFIFAASLLGAAGAGNAFDNPTIADIDAEDLLINHAKYHDTFVNVINMRCYFGGKADYRCSNLSGTLSIQAPKWIETSSIPAIERECDTFRKMRTSDMCLFTVRIKALKPSELVENSKRIRVYRYDWMQTKWQSKTL